MADKQPTERRGMDPVWWVVLGGMMLACGVLAIIGFVALSYFGLSFGSSTFSSIETTVVILTPIP